MQPIETKLAGLVGRLKDAAGTNLESVLLYGSAARGEHREGKSDLNLLCTLVSLSAAELHRIAPAVNWWTKEQLEPSPLFFTESELRSAADVFAIELLDIQRDHRVLFGKDVVAGIHVPTNLHRIQVEHELRTMLLKLRQQFLLSAHDEKTLRAVFARSISSATTLARHALIALGEQPPASARAVFARVAERSAADAKAFELGLEIRENGPKVDIVAAYGAYLRAIEQLTAALDRHAPKHQWQRAAP
jgi:hypothetical protein